MQRPTPPPPPPPLFSKRGPRPQCHRAKADLRVGQPLPSALGRRVICYVYRWQERRQAMAFNSHQCVRVCRQAIALRAGLCYK